MLLARENDKVTRNHMFTEAIEQFCFADNACVATKTQKELD